MFIQGAEQRGSRGHNCQTSSVKVQGLRANGQVSQRARIPRGGVPRVEGRSSWKQGFQRTGDRGGVTRCQIPAPRSLPVSGAAASMPAVAANSGLYL